MDNDAKNISVENDAIEMPFIEDTGDVKEEVKPESDTIDIPFEEVTTEEERPVEEKTEVPTEPVVETPVETSAIETPAQQEAPDLIVEETPEVTPTEEVKEAPITGPIIDERIINNPIYNKKVSDSQVEDKVGPGLSLSENSNMIIDDRIKNNPAYQNVSFDNSDVKVDAVSNNKDIIQKDKKSVFGKNVFTLKHKSILLPVIAFLFAVILGIYLFISSSQSKVVNLIRITEANKVGYMDSDGTIVVKSKYLSGTEFYNGFAIVKNDNNLYCVLNGKGAFEVPCGNYTYIGLYDGKYIASKITNGGLKQALLNKDLDNITKFKYDNISYINNGIFTFRRDATVGVLNSAGKEIYKFELDEVDDKNIILEVSDSKSKNKYARIKVNDSTTIVNIDTGKEVYKYTLNEVSVLDNNIFSIKEPEKENNTYIYIEDDEVKFTTNQYKVIRIDDYNSNIALCIKNNSKVDYINLTNSSIINNNDNNEYYYNDGIVLEKTHDFNLNTDVYNIIDYTGKIGSFSSINPVDKLFYNGMLKVIVYEDKYNYINTKGKTISNKSYDVADNFEENGYAVVANNEKYGILDTKANEIVSLSYAGIEQLDKDLYKTLKEKYDLEIFAFKADNNKIGFITNKNKEYIPATYNSYEMVDDEYPFVKVYYGSEPVLLNLVNKKEINIDNDSVIQIKDNYVIVNNKYYNYNGKLIYSAK